MKNKSTEFKEQQIFLNSDNIKRLLAKYKTQISSDKILNCGEFLNNQHYYLQSFISAGSFGAVLLGVNSLTKEKVAIKLLIAQDKETRSQWIQEGQKIQSIISPNVMQIITWFEDEKNECIYLVMEYCENGNLAQYVKSHVLSPNQIIKLFISILKGLEDIHKKSIIHSDIKPTNIILGKDFEPKICDFGLSKILQKGQTHVSSSAGTLNYQPMEQVNNRLVLESDYYATGCILCFMCNVPIEEDMNLMLKLKNGEFPQIQDGKFKKIVQVAYSMMKFNPKERITPVVAQNILQSISNNDFRLSNNEYMGNYVQGLKSGKGIEFYQDGKKKYQGEWLKDKKEGQGIYFYQNGETLEVSHKNGLKQGDGVEKYSNGQIKFKGAWFNDFKHGKGITYLENGDIIEATYEKGQKTGYGKETLNNGLIVFEGQFLNYKKNGQGILFENNLKFEGEFVNDKKNGKGKIFENGSLKFEGEFVNDKKNGQGKLFENYSLKFEGEFVNDKFHSGTLNYRNGESYVGTFKNDLRDGEGILLTREKNKKYEGQYSEDKYNGKGIFYDENGEIYSGTFLNGELNGKCLHYKKGVEVPEERNYKNGFPENGYYKQIDKEGHIVFEGQMKNFYYQEGDYYENGKLKLKGVFDEIDQCTRLINGIRYIDGIKQYEGSFVNGYYEGFGKLYQNPYLFQDYYDKTYKNDKLVYEGEFKSGSYSGKGSLYKNGKLIYEGDFSNGVYDGFGLLYNYDTLIYKGEFKGGLYQGNGSLYSLNELAYEDEFQIGYFDGKGIEQLPNGEVWEGTFSNNSMVSGIIKFKNGSILNLNEGRYTGRMKYPDLNESYEGEFNDTFNRHGKGILYKGKFKVFEGQYLNDRMYNGYCYKSNSMNKKYKYINGQKYQHCSCNIF